MFVHSDKYLANICFCLSLVVGLIVTEPTAALPKSTSSIKYTPYSEPINTTTTVSAKLLPTITTPLTSTKNSKENAEISTKAHSSTRSPSVMHTTRVMHGRTKAEEKISSRGKLNSTISVGDNRAMTTTVAAAVAPTRSLDRRQNLGPIDCDLPTLPRESRLWRANETHELNIPFTMELSNIVCVKRVVEECPPASSAPTGPEEDCSPDVLLWEGTADMQAGDILIVRINDSQLGVNDAGKSEGNTNNTVDADNERVHTGPAQPAVYQVTRLGHEHCDTADGMLLDITPLDYASGVKIFTLYDKDLTEGVNLLIVVSENWGSKCVRLRVTVKSDNCGESQVCSGKGVCYTNVSMDGYECQCCPGFVGPQCAERNACDPSPCLNNGICVDITQPRNTSVANFHCLCPYGFTGKKCEKDPCYSSPCLNGGSCMSMSVNGTTRFHCACADGWAGEHCQLSAVSGSGGGCASSPCTNGICIDHTDGDVDIESYKCYCRPGFTGNHCELEYNECESSPCANGGTCTDRVAGFSCACGRGYTGNACQLKVDLCSPNPCSSRRLCIDHGNSYSCDCPRGYIGEECSVLAKTPCDHNPCAHGGTCWNGIEMFSCSCRPGYTGRLCEDDFIIESVVGGEGSDSVIGSGSVRDLGLPLGLYHDRLHNVYIAVGTLGAALAIVGVVVTACHCRVNKTYSRLLSRVRGRGVAETGGVTGVGSRHWLHPRPPAATAAPAPILDHDMYYTLDFSDSQTSPLIQ